MSLYAQGTSVPVDKSRAEIERTLARYGASKFAYGTDAEAGTAQIMFEVNRRSVRMRLTLPPSEAFSKTDRGRTRTYEAAKREWEQACRQRWRALALVVKAKLEAIESGIATFDDEWLAYLVLPGTNKTIGEKLAAQLETVMTSKAPLMLDMGGGT